MRYSSLPSSLLGYLISSKCIMSNFNVHRPFRVIKEPKMYIQRWYSQRSALSKSHSISASFSSEAVKKASTPAWKRNVSSGSITASIAAHPEHNRGSNYLYLQIQMYLSEKSSHLFSHLKTTKINSEWRSDHYFSVCATHISLCTSLKHDSHTAVTSFVGSMAIYWP